jgi:hypothetical protein
MEKGVYHIALNTTRGMNPHAELATPQAASSSHYVFSQSFGQHNHNMFTFFTRPTSAGTHLLLRKSSVIYRKFWSKTLVENDGEFAKIFS